MPLTQDNQYFKVSTPLGKDKLIFRNLQGNEKLSELFEYTVEVISETNNLAFDNIVGKPVGVTLEFTNSYKRYIHGIATAFTQARSDKTPNAETHLTVYHITLRPWFWFLTLTKNCQIFQNMSTPEIIKAIFKGLGFSDFKDSLRNTYTKREYCVQYDESAFAFAFAFVCRLMEDDGIFYFFEHTESKHTLVLADDLSVHKNVIGYNKVRYWEIYESSNPENVIYKCLMSQQTVPAKYAIDDYHFETPATNLMTEVSGKSKSKMRIYEYQGYQGGIDTTGAADKVAKNRIQSFEWQQKILFGESYCIGFGAGGKFTLEKHPRKNLNSEYVIYALSISASLTEYSNSFQAIPATVQFRPIVSTPKPRIAGLQTAVVTGPKGEEIYTDKYGRIKVQFHWDQKGKKDDKTTCFIRVNQSWAGKAWGRLFLPRIGQEVLVSFVNGDPDRPLVIGSVYNAEQTVPYALPTNKTKSTLKTRSTTKGGAKDFNEISFEDKKGKELFYQHAQKDMHIMVEHDRQKTVGNNEVNKIKKNRTTTIEEEHETLTINKGNRFVYVKKGNETHEVKGKRDLKITGNETHKNDANFTHEVTGNYKLKVTGKLTIEATGKIVIKGSQDIQTEAGMNIKEKAGMNFETKAGLNIKNKAGINLENQAGVSVKNKANVSIENKANVSIKSTANVSLENKGNVMIKNEGGAMMKEKGGAMGQVEGGGILIIKGGIVMIN